MLRRLNGALAIVFLVAGGAVHAANDDDVDRLIAELGSPDPLTSERAEEQIRNLGVDAVDVLAARIANPDVPFDRRLERIFRANLTFLLDEFEGSATALAEDKVELKRLEDLVASRPDDEELAERRRIVAERISATEPRFRKDLARVNAIAVAGLGEIIKRFDSVSPILLTFYAAVFESVVAERDEAEIFVPADSPAFERRRYLLSPLWLWIGSRKDEKRSTDAAELLERHMALTFAELSSPSYLVRERAEDEFYMLGPRGLEFLRARSALRPTLTDRLIDLLDWRIHPRLREQTSMDFRNYRKLSFRERRSKVIRYARTAGREAIPTLRLIVLDEKREPSVRVKLAAAEQLAGLGDRTGIVTLMRKPLPELTEIPEISRDFFILKGVQYQREEKYELAMAEFRKVLDDSPFHFDANYRMAFTNLLAKNFKESIYYFEIARKIRPGDTLTLYNLACAYSLDGQIDKALDLLEESIKAGFTDANHIAKDPDMDPLRESERYKKIMLDLRADRAPGE